MGGETLNPFAVGHLINHTPRDGTTNVCLIDLFIPKAFFPFELMKFWPNIYDSMEIDRMQMNNPTLLLNRLYPKTQFMRGLGVISVEEIKDGQELFLDYLESCLFDMEAEVPDWLIKPPPMHPRITKESWITKPSLLIKLLEDYAFR